ncbi:calmodulin-regulated spectrin-associated protein 3 isoform X2 [Boleophthalmus pectinirostris]|nr:calmodulin-regulated spectrin-associated protein 3 isoform X2 [Boleophthalmus pectinirostris]
MKKDISVRTEEGQVTDKELSQSPIRLKAHLALVDGLMALAAQDTLDQVKMAAEAEAGPGAAWENALLFWVNKINQSLRESTEEEEQPPKAPNCTDAQPAQDPSQSSRWYWKLVPIRYRKDKVQSKLTPTFPLVSGLKDLSNGSALGAVLHFYCPSLLPLEDVCLKDTMSVADSVYNLQLIRTFCETHLHKCCPLQVEDLLYAPPLLHTNILVFLSELMNCFEVQKPDFVRPVQPVDLTDMSGVLDCTSPVSGHNNSGSPSYIFKQPFVPIPPEVSAENQSWAKKQISGPLSAVAFSIPFGLDSDVDIVMGNPIDCVFHPVSSDGLAPAVPAMTSPVSAYSPPEDLSHLISSSAPAPRSWGPYMTPLGELPTIEEALQVNHPRKSRPEPRLRPEGAPAGFYLHSPEKEDSPLSSSIPARGGGRDRGRSSDMSRDDDSVLRDGSVDSSEASDDTPRNTPGNIRPNWGRQSTHSPSGSPRMTSFAERRDTRRRQPAAPGEEASSAPTTPGSPAVGAVRQDSPGTPGPDALVLGARLEEKRKSIEAQKRRIEAIFAKHRQRLGKTAFLQLQREQGEGGGDTGGDSTTGDTEDQLSLDERLTQVEEQLQREEEREQKEKVSAPPRLEKQVTFSLDNKDMKDNKDNKDSKDIKDSKERGGGAGSLGPGVPEYTEVVQKLSEALECLQKDMQKLTQQQQQLLSGQWPRTTPKNSPKSKPSPSASKTPPRTPTKTPTRSVSKAWLIPAAPSVSHRSSASAKTALSSSCPAPRTRATTTPRSPKAHSRPHASHPRPSELKFPPLTRVLTPPQSVDSLPHLRRVSPSKCQVQTSSSFRIGGPQTPQESPQTAPPPQPEESTSDTGSSETPTQFSLELDQEERSSTQDIQQPAVESSPSECSLQSETLSLSAFSVGPDGGPAGDKCSLMASLSSLGPGEGGSDDHTDETHEFSSDSMSDHTEGAAAEARGREHGAPPSESSTEGPPPSESSAEGLAEPFSSDTGGEQIEELSGSAPRGGVGFFFMEGAHREEDMAQRRAALLERQQRRSEELKRRRQWHEHDPDNRPDRPDQRAASPSGSPAGHTSSSPTAPATPARRGDFTRGEYARRQQLRIMDDLDKMLKQKSTATGRAPSKKTRARPRSMTREGTQLSLSPAKSTPGSRLTKVYSHSSLNLPATGDTRNSSGELTKPDSRPASPCRQDKDCDPGSSGASSAPDYTGPKLFKEPSFKSNKFIIHNALSRCCLAGKVNEAQKNKIVEEMEKSPANHFLILFRDSSCQFRGVYTLNPDAQELVRLTGVGPRSVSCAQVQSIYKYSSDRKQFCPIPSKTLGMSVDAFTIPGPLWQGGGAGGGATRRASITRKSTASNK